MAVLVTLPVSGCTTRTIKLPNEQGTFNTMDTVRVFAQVTARCNDSQSWTGAIAIDGTLDDRVVRGRLLGAFSPSAVRLEAVSRAGTPSFVFVSIGTQGVVRLPGSGRLQSGESTDIMQALIGLRMPPAVIGRTLAACEFPDGFRTMRTIGTHWARFPLPGGSMYLHRTAAANPWRLMTMFYPGDTLHWSWRADYHDVHQGFPLRTHLITADGRVDLQIRLSQVDTTTFFSNDDARFQVGSPVEELRLALGQLRAEIYKGLRAR